MMEERLVKGEYCLSTGVTPGLDGVTSSSSLPSTSSAVAAQLSNDIKNNDDVQHCACITKLETQVEEQVSRYTSFIAAIKFTFCFGIKLLEEIRFG